MNPTRVLVLDDEVGRGTGMDSVMDDIQAEEDMEVLGLKSVSEVRRLLAEETDPPDVIVLDIMMPPGSLGSLQTDHGQTTGIMLLDMIREKMTDVPVIVLSGKDKQQLQEDIDRREVAEILVKPVWTPDLIARIRAITQRR